jgi:hypothetical protein
LCLPDLVALDLPAIVEAAGYPSTTVVPALSSILSLLALKLTSTARVSHVEDLATDAGTALFAGLSSLPKTSALTSYSYKLSHEQQRAFLGALDRAMIKAGLIEGADFDLDLHAIMHWGEDAALEKHNLPRRSQRTRAVLTFFAQDGDSHNLIYANADLSKAAQGAGGDRLLRPLALAQRSGPRPARVRPEAHHPAGARRARRARRAVHDAAHALPRADPPHRAARPQGVEDRAPRSRGQLPQTPSSSTSWCACPTTPARSASSSRAASAARRRP